jgi:hypothetical protein
MATAIASARMTAPIIRRSRASSVFFWLYSKPEYWLMLFVWREMNHFR